MSNTSLSWVHQVVMSNLRRPQEVQCLRYSIGLLHRVCSAPHCRTVKVLSHFAHQDAVTLWSIISGDSEVSFARLQVLTILSSMLFTHKGRQVLRTFHYLISNFIYDINVGI